MKLSLPNAVTTRVAKQALVAKKNSPRILFVSGIALMGATVVTACKGTLQLEGVLDDVRKDREDVLAVAEARPEKYSEHDVKKLNMYITGKGMARVAKLYLPSIALGVAAVACLTASHNQLNRRNAGLSAALAATERALDNYRGRVRANLGDDKELELWRGETTETNTITDPDTGKKTKVTLKNGGGTSPYARVWGRDTSTEWDSEEVYNLAKLRSVQSLMQLKLDSKGHVFLNEVFDELGLERTPAGAVVGWLSEKEGKRLGINVDGYIDFGVMTNDPEQELRFLDFATGREDHIVLDFNVDGEIWRMI